jgi:transglutaminase-like putative cysteine protease
MSPGDITNLGLSDEVAFRVDFEGRAPLARDLYWRGPVLIDFDGRTWTRRQGMNGNPRRVEPVGEPTKYRVTLDPAARGWTFALDMPQRWDERLFRMNSDFQLELIPVGRRSRAAAARNYEVTSYTSYAAIEPLSDANIAGYLRLPPESSPRTRALVAEWLADNPTDEQIVERAFDWLASQPFFYTLTPPPLGEQPVDEFLFDTREGFCEHYASAFAVMLRAAGVPTRIVTGYQGGEINGFTDLHVVRQADAHAWTEVWLGDRGWVRVDPVTAVLPERVAIGSLRGSLGVQRTARFAAAGWLRNAVFLWDAVQTYWSRAIIGYNAESQRSFLEDLGFGDLRFNERFLVLGVLVFSAVLVLAVALSLYLQWRARLRRGADAAARAFAAFARRLARLRVAPRAPNEDPAEFALRAAAVLPHAANDIAAITRAYLAARYEDDREGRALTELRDRVAAFAPRSARHAGA